MSFAPPYFFILEMCEKPGRVGFTERTHEDEPLPDAAKQAKAVLFFQAQTQEEFDRLCNRVLPDAEPPP